MFPSADPTYFFQLFLCYTLSFTEVLLPAPSSPLAEVVRTRLREPGNKYSSFWQSLQLVYREEGRAGLYRGLATNLVRQIPNTAVMMATYELVVHLVDRQRGAGRANDS